MKEQISRESDVEHRKQQQGIRHAILINCVTVDYRCTWLDERRSVSTTVLHSIPQVEHLNVTNEVVPPRRIFRHFLHEETRIFPLPVIRCIVTVRCGGGHMKFIIDLNII